MNLDDALKTAPENDLIRNTMRKADLLLNSYKNPVCSISGGSDSDIMMDLLERVRGNRKIIYVWFDTGIEYDATKRHLVDLEQKYGVEIVRRKAPKPVPVGCKEYGVPFLSKEASMYISRLQNKGFGFNAEHAEIENAKAACRWWNSGKEQTRFSVSRNTGLKEYMMNAPPNFQISDKCCKGAKKDAAAQVNKEFDTYMVITGERRAEGGVRATKIHSCFDVRPNEKVQRYRPLFFWTDADKQQYKEHYGLRYSDCYEIYGMKRTGCAGCPFNSRFEQDLEVIKQYEPKLYQAANAIFGKSYEYTRAYRKFKAEMKRGGQQKMEDV